MVQTHSSYDTRNSQVTLTVDFYDYDTQHGLYSVVQSATTVDLVVDMSKMPVPNPEEDSNLPPAPFVD